MRQQLINVYKFEELSDEVKEKVIDRFRKDNNYPFLSDDLNEELKSLLEENKIEVSSNLKLYYSLSYNQGDGVCFVGIFKWNKYYVTINHRGNYYHRNSKEIHMEPIDDNYDNSDNDEDPFSNIDDTICDKLEKFGYSIIEYESTVRYIKETIEINEFEFNDNGDIV